MELLKIQNYEDSNLLVVGDNVQEYMSNDNEVLSGSPPPSETLYLDLAATGSGHAGTEGDPYSIADWQSHLAANPSLITNFMVRGRVTYAGTINLRGSNWYCSYTPWNSKLYGPWKLKCENLANTFQCTINRGMIFFETSGVPSSASLTEFFTCNDSYISGVNLVTTAGINFYRCLVSLQLFDMTGGGTWENNAFAVNSMVVGGFTNCYNSAFTVGSVPANVQDVGNTNQFGWSAPTMPAFDGVKADFNTSVLYANVTTPQPGASYPFDGAYDLFGNPVSGIGAGNHDYDAAAHYVDLDLGTDGHAGTFADPWSYTDWQTWTIANNATNDRHYFRLRGSADVPTEIVRFLQNTTNGGCRYRAWNLELYGPWRLNCLTVYTHNLNIMYDCIIQYNITNNLSQLLSTNNCYILAPLATEFNAASNVMARGCLFDIAGVFHPTEGLFWDCCVKASSYAAANYGFTATNCAFTGNSGYILNDTQTDWVAPALPAWNEPDPAAFSTAVLFADVDTPPQPGIGAQGVPKYLSFEFDLWGNERTGIGTGLMAVAVTALYVDLAAVGTGHAGTDVDAFSFDDFIADIADADVGTEYRLKGSFEYAGSTAVNFVGLNGGHSFLPWDAATNGPWRIRIATADVTFTDSTETFNGGIFSFGSGSPILGQLINVSNMYFKFDGAVTFGIPGGSHLKGCTIDSAISFTFGSGQYTDCVFVAPIVDGGGSTLNNCAISGAYTASGMTLNNCQTNWVAPVMPAWDAANVAFVAQIIYAGISTPPKPGNVPYTGYDIDLFGNARAGIGAGFFAIAPTINIQPVSVFVDQGQTATLSVTASGSLPLTYQWYRYDNSDVMPGNIRVPLVESAKFIGVQTDTLQVTNAQPIDIGRYRVIVSDGVLPDAISLVSSNGHIDLNGNPTATVYVDLDATGTAYSAGTDVDPLTGDIFFMHIKNSPITSIYYLKGTYETSQFNVLSGFAGCGEFNAWDKSTNGPWKLKVDIGNGTLLVSPNDLFTDAILELYNSSSGEVIASGGRYVNCVIISDGKVSFAGGNTSGCTVVADEINFGGGIIKNNIMIANSITGGGANCSNCALSFVTNTAGGMTFTNSLLTASDGGLLGWTLTNCTLGWNPTTTWPSDAFGNVQTFYNSVLSAGIGIPPQPGATPYLETTTPLSNFDYSQDLWGNTRTGIGAVYFDLIWNTTFPQASIIGETTITFQVQGNKAGIAYFVVVPNGAAAPTVAQVIAGQNGAGSPVAVGFSGNVAIVANVTNTLVATNLLSPVSYDVYFALVDGLGNTSIAPVMLDVTTIDITDPVWTPTYPSISDVGINSIDVAVSLIEAATVYGVVLPKGSAAPTPAQIIAGTDASDTPVSVDFAKNVAASASIATTLSFTNVLINADYEVYVVARDTSLNVQNNATMFEVTTLPLISKQNILPNAEIGQIITININSLAVITTKDFPTIFRLGVFPGSGYEIIQLGEKTVEVKIAGTSLDSRSINIKVGDGIVVSDTFLYKVKVTKAQAPKEKPISYGGTSVNPPDPFTPPFRRV